MRRIALLAVSVLLIMNGRAQSSASTPPLAEPAISPDGAEIAFVSGADIWTVPAKGGEARLLIASGDNDSRPVYAPDGRSLAFTSTRSGNGDIYIFTFESGNIRRLTYDDGLDEVSAWSNDGKYIYFSSTSRDISGMRDIFRVQTEGGTPMAVTDDRYTSEFFGMPSPDGTTLAFSARGVASYQWWRKGHSHLDESEIWLRREGKPAAYERITERGAKNLWPMWSTDGKLLYFVSDRTGNQNLFLQPLGGTAKQLTKFTGGRVLWPSISHDGKEIVFERDFKIWKYDIASGNASEVKISRRGAAAGPAIDHQRMTTGFRQMTLSPDGRKVAFVAHGEIFASSSREGGDAARVTRTVANESQITWTPNSNGLVYVSDRDGADHLYTYNFTTNTEARLTNESLDDGSPVFSPDGKMLAFVRNGLELRVIDWTTKKEALLAKGYLGRSNAFSSSTVVWSPDSKWLAYSGYGVKTFRNVYVVPAAGGEAKPVSFLPNYSGGRLSWSPDGKFILVSTAQRTENTSIARIDLTPVLPRFAEDQFESMFTEQRVPDPQLPVDPARIRPANPAPRPDTTLASAPRPARAATTPVRIVFEGINQRLTLLPLDVDVNSYTVSKDGKTLLISAALAGQSNLYTYSLDDQRGGRQQGGLRQLTSSGGPKSDAQFSPDGKEVFYMEQGRIQSIALDTRVPRPLAVTAEMDVDFTQEKTEIFHQAWNVLNRGYYDPNFHGADWPGVKATYEPLVAGSSTPDELRRLLNLMVGELNSSHSGVSGPPGNSQIATGRIGLRYDREEYEKNGRLRITEIVRQGPTSLSDSVHIGDYLTAIDGTPITGKTNADQLLDNKINRKVVLSIASAPGGQAHKVVVSPVSQQLEKNLLYKQWVQQEREYVTKISRGRLGYVHMNDMSEQSLNQLYLDLDAENQAKDGVIVDIRNNNGGFVNAYALDVLSRKPYLTMTGRDMPSAPARTQLGQRTLELPTILVTNQHSLSDAEDFTEGYRTMQLGKVVGEPTGGWIIFTGSAQLIDGTTVRLPFSRITDNKGTDMELHPRSVDIPVSRSIGETYTGKDSQLDTAVKELLSQIDKAKTASK